MSGDETGDEISCDDDGACDDDEMVMVMVVRWDDDGYGVMVMVMRG